MATIEPTPATTTDTPDHETTTPPISDPDVPLTWIPSVEDVLTEWADCGMCYKILHLEAHRSFNYKNRWYIIPGIILGTLTGVANFTIASMPTDMQQYAQISIGLVNIVVAFISTIHQNLKIAELTESHRIYSLLWDKFSRDLKCELRKPPDERNDATQFYKNHKNEYDKLILNAPLIPKYCVTRFMNSNMKDPVKRRIFREIFKPDICGELVPTKTILYVQEHDHDVETGLGCQV